MQPLRGISLKILSVTLFMAMASLIKAASRDVPIGEVVFFRAFFALPVIVGWLIATRRFPGGLRTKRPMTHVWRGVIGTMAMGLGFAALPHLQLPEATAIGYAAPLLVVILAALVLGEQVRLFRISTVLLGLVGVLIVLWPRLDFASFGGDATARSAAIGAIFALSGAVFAAFAQIHVRRMVETESTAAIVFYFSITSALLGLATLPFGWVWPSGTLVLMMVCAGILGGLGQIMLTSAYRFADASVVAPFDYASIVLAILSGLIFFDEVPTSRTLIGSALVILAGVIIIWREHQLGLKRGRARRLMPPIGR